MKALYSLLIFIFLIISSYLYYEDQTKCAVYRIVSPTEIFIDINRNLIYDEKEPIKVENLHYINMENNPIEFKDLTENQKFFLNYKAFRTSQLILKDKYVRIVDGIIIVDGFKYNDLLKESGFFYTNTPESKAKLLEYIKTINLDDYVLYNTKSKRYHSLDCKEGKKSKNYRIIKKINLDENAIGCKNCIIDEETKEALETIKESTPINSSKLEKGQISVIYTDLNETFLPTTKCETKACKVLKKEIDSAEETIDFAVYGINNQPEIYNALVNAYNRGVKIRWVADYDKKDQNYYPDTLKLQKIITTYNTDKETDLSGQSAIMHNKFFIFDNKKVFTGSANITSTDIAGFNSNISVLLNSEQVAKIFTQEFEQMYNGAFHKDKKAYPKEEININGIELGVFFSPQDKIITKEILPIINNAKSYIYIPVFYITKKELVNELIAAHKRGVEVKIINDATNASNKYTIHHQLREAGIKVKTENYAGKLHSKAMIIDDEYSIIGSMNFTNSGEKRNDENVVIIKDEEIAQYLKSTFLKLWDKIPEKYETFDPQAESLESIGSCFDKIDNDFDGKIDKADNSCKSY